MYNRIIRETLKISQTDARLVEAYLRLIYSTLDALSRDDIYWTYQTSVKDAIYENPVGANELALSYGL